MEWLSLIRYQLESARAQMRQPPPLNALSLSSAHDAVESMMGLCIEVHKVDVKDKATFMELFNAVDKAVPENAKLGGHRTGLKALNADRVNFKHSGSRPSASTIERHLANATSFLEAASEAALSTRLDEVSLVHLVADQEVREALQAAQNDWNSSRAMEAFQGLWIAYDLLIGNYAYKESYDPGGNSFSTRPAFAPNTWGVRSEGKSMEMAYRWLENVDSWIVMSTMGIDPRKYAYFRYHVPPGSRSMSGEVRFQKLQHQKFTQEIFGACFQFVVEAALTLYKKEFAYDAWAARRPGDGGV